MNAHDCGCGGSGNCGCCDGIASMTPVGVDNRPGLPALNYRVGTHGRFLASMRSRLPTMEVVAPGNDHQTLQSFRPLQALTTRDPADPAIALLDAWATVSDVLTFYQERIANEGYVRTATERRSLVELSRLVGYAPRPGVSASVYLSYTVDDNQAEPVELAIGTRAQTIPGPDELPQSFETDEPLQARREWNDLQIRRERPQGINTDNIIALERVYVKGSDTGVQPGQLLLFRFGEGTQAQYQVRRVAKVESDFVAQRSAIVLQPLPVLLPQAVVLLNRLINELILLDMQGNGDAAAIDNAKRLLAAIRLGAPYWPMAEWGDKLTFGVEGESIDLIEAFGVQINELKPAPSAPPTSSPDEFVDKLLLKPIVQAANPLRLRRDLGTAFDYDADLQPQLITQFAPRLKDSYYTAWRGSNASTYNPYQHLSALYVLGAGETLFGAGSAKPMPAISNNTVPAVQNWADWVYASDESTSNAFLGKADPLLAAGDLILVARPAANADSLPDYDILPITAARTGPRNAYGMSGETTEVEFGEGGKPAQWRTVKDGNNNAAQIVELRRTWLHPQRQALDIVAEPILSDVSGNELELGPLHQELKSGRWVVIEGERSDIEGVRGVRASELMMVTGLRHGYNHGLPGDRPHTTLNLATPLANTYYRDGLRIHANVVPASHGESRREVLGSSDARKPMQRFALKQPPLTWRPAPTAAGAASTLKVLVDEVEWSETDSLAGLSPDARAFVTQTDDSGVTSVVFGDGVQGMRPPSGFENLRAEYRNGIGQGGNVRAGQISLLVTRPLGIKEVINPLRSSGGADRETLQLIRENAPRSLMALDRLVSLSDYADFTRMFAGIAKADAVRLGDGARELVHITVAGVDDMPIDEDSDLYRNLLTALRELGDPALTVQVAMRERLALVLQAKLRLLPGYRWEPVVSAVRARLLDRFGFHARALGQPALLCEVVAAIQSVRGIDWVDVDSFGAIPETEVDYGSGERRLITQDGITETVQRIVYGDQGDFASDDDDGESYGPIQPPTRVDAQRARREYWDERYRIVPAQLAFFAPAVPDTLILNPVQ